MLALPADEVHIHLLGPGFKPGLDWHSLSGAELERAKAFKFSKDRQLYVAAHVFLRQVLSQYADVPANAWQFVCNAYGKPAVANAGYGWLQFNLSHTQGAVACAVARNRQVGVDVEGAKPLLDLPGLCRSVLSQAEADEVLAAGDLAGPLFYRYWTLKEAYIKAQGMGLSLPLQQFSFVKSTPPYWQLVCDPGLPANQEHWQFSACCLGASHYLAYCAQAGQPASPQSLIVKLITADPGVNGIVLPANCVDIQF